MMGYKQLFKNIQNDPNILQMTKFKHHVIYTTYDHCVNVTQLSLKIGIIYFKKKRGHNYSYPFNLADL